MYQILYRQYSPPLYSVRGFSGDVTWMHDLVSPAVIIAFIFYIVKFLDPFHRTWFLIYLFSIPSEYIDAFESHKRYTLFTSAATVLMFLSPSPPHSFWHCYFLLRGIFIPIPYDVSDYTNNLLYNLCW